MFLKCKARTTFQIIQSASLIFKIKNRINNMHVENYIYSISVVMKVRYYTLPTSERKLERISMELIQRNTKY